MNIGSYVIYGGVGVVNVGLNGIPSKDEVTIMATSSVTEHIVTDKAVPHAFVHSEHLAQLDFTVIPENLNILGQESDRISAMHPHELEEHITEGSEALRHMLFHEGDGSIVDAITVKAGHLYIYDISILDVGSTLVIGLTGLATVVRAFYDFSAWLDRRRINKHILRHQLQKAEYDPSGRVEEKYDE